MSIIVSRTCTEVPPGNGRAIASDPKRLREYRSVPAYVLLGDPGTGKTTEFQRECSELGDTALFVPASDFIELHLDSHPEWRDRTLFIDGLDEMRAGAAGIRDPLGEIRNRLDQLGCPNFRISCREADWLGPTDRRSLTVVSPDSEITVLMLDRLSDHAIRELLVGQVGSAKAESFERDARDRGLGAMLHNPQALKLLIDAVGQGDEWPRTRLQTFELACLKMASEHNEERQEAVSSYRTEAALDAAGCLCALLLLCGFEGYTLARGGDTGRDGSAGLVPLDEMGRAVGDMSRQVLRDALSTNLFVPEGERGFVPCHRQVAEFLAGRWLSELVKAGLPARRVVALMRGPSDGRVVTALRGLSAWLAAQSGEARRQLIEADPVGVGLYGDIATFVLDDRERLLRSLTAFAAQGSLFGHEWRDSRANEYRYSTGWAFRSLASTDLVESIKRLLDAPVDEAEHGRAVEFILDVLANAETSETKSLAVLAPDLLSILYDTDRPPRVTIRALYAYMHIAPSGSQTDETLVALLDRVQQGSIPDEGDDLRRALLKQLYPNVIRPADVWRYALPGRRQHATSSIGSFWDRNVVKESSDHQISELLDALCEDAQHLVPALAHSYLDDLPLQLVARGLCAFGDTLEAQRLFCWLDVTGRTHRALRRKDEDVRFVRRWLEERPEVQKELFLAWLRERVISEPAGLHRHLSCDPLLNARPPSDLGLWCLDQATALEDSESALARELLGQAYWALADPVIWEGLTLEVMHERVGTGLLARRLAELESQRSTDAEIEAEADERRRAIDERREQLAEEEQQRQAGWREGLRSHLDSLRNNRFFASNLHTLAEAYLGEFVDSGEEASSRQRIHDFIGGEEELVEAVMTAIRDAVFRDDVPAVDETISLHSESKHSWLAYPVLASLHLLDDESPARLDEICADRKRRALAIHYCVPSDDESPPWHDRWFQQEPTLVLEVLQQCAVRAVRAGAKFVPCLDTLDSLNGHDDSVPVLAFNNSTALFETRPQTPRSGGHDDLVHDTRLRVLAAIPTRAPNQQMGLLDSLLARAMQHPDTVSLRELAARKLSLHSMGIAQRVRWLTVDSLLSEDPSLQPIKRYVRVKNTEVRVRHFAEFLRRTSHRDDMRRSVLAGVREPEVLRDAIEILNSSFGPVHWGGGFITLGMEMSELLGTLIEQLGTIAGNDADRAFTELTNDPSMTRWRDRLTWAHERQRVVHRDASYRHPSINEVQRTLNNEAPASEADLVALLQDRIADISADMRDSNDNPWRKYWNEDPYRRPTTPKPEESCRDVLVEALRDRLSRLSPEVSVDPETRYTAETRADLSVRCGDLNVPVEIKKNSHRDLWSALRRQLIGKYTSGRTTSGYGIYLVLWFGADATTTSPDGNRPDAPEELKRRLEQELTSDEARKISVIVIDVTKPGESPLPPSRSTTQRELA